MGEWFNSGWFVAYAMGFSIIIGIYLILRNQPRSKR